MALSQTEVWERLAATVPECARLLPAPFGFADDTDGSLAHDDYLLAGELVERSLQPALADPSFEDEEMLDRWFHFLEGLWANSEASNLAVVGFLEHLRWFEPIPERVRKHAGVLAFDSWLRLHPDLADW